MLTEIKFNLKNDIYFISDTVVTKATFIIFNQFNLMYLKITKTAIKIIKTIQKYSKNKMTTTQKNYLKFN